MFVHRVASPLALLLMLLAQPAWAFLDPPYITPVSPTAGDTISVNVYGGQCDLLNIGISPPVVTQQGSAITIVFTGTHEGDPEFCIYGIGTTTYPVSSYPAGSYTLQVDRRYIGFSGTWLQETLGVIPFSVTGATSSPAPASAPTLGVTTLSLLLMALTGLGVWHLRSARA